MARDERDRTDCSFHAPTSLGFFNKSEKFLLVTDRTIACAIASIERVPVTPQIDAYGAA
jgi:hypothetical protein